VFNTSTNGVFVGIFACSMRPSLQQSIKLQNGKKKQELPSTNHHSFYHRNNEEKSP
jgi:hypothetical protein